MIDKGLVIQARRASIEQYLRGKGETLLKEGRQYRIKGHPGLVVSGNKWYSHTLLKGGNALDYLVDMEGIIFKEAVEILSNNTVIVSGHTKSSNTGQVSMPERNVDDKRVIAYLVKARGISPEIVIYLLKKGRIYESAGTHNCVFTGVDATGTVKYVMQRSTLTSSSLKFESKGSDKRYSFSLIGKCDIINVFESPIDLLSYMVLQKESLKEQPHMLSLGGVTDIALEAYTTRATGIKQIVLCLDNDKVGKEACETLYKKYSQYGFKVCKHFPVEKDWLSKFSDNQSYLSKMVIRQKIR